MSTDIRRITEQVLEQLRDSMQADILTCHYGNPYSGYWWPLYRSGDVKYPYQLRGFLTHRAQRDRMASLKEYEDGEGIAYFSTLPEELSRDTFGGETFVRREGIAASIRLRVEQPLVGQAVVFLNYRKRTSLPSTDDAKARIKTLLPVVRESVLSLAAEPRLDARDAWRLRSLLLGFGSEAAECVGNRGLEGSQRLFKHIVEQARELIRPLQGDNVLCSLSEVRPDNSIRMLATSVSDGRAISELGGGVVEYVGQTGQTFVIDNTEEYRTVVTADDRSRPRYVEYHPHTRAELACPLVIQDRVIGVLNLEANQPGSYADTHVGMLSNFAFAAAFAVRQATLWRDLDVVQSAQQRSLAADARLEDIVLETQRVATELGYDRAVVWHDSTQLWYGGGWRESPRTPGFTRWVMESGALLALADVRIEEVKGATFQAYEGQLDGRGLFEAWSKLDVPPVATISPDLERLVRESGAGVVTAVAFPIVETRGRSGGASEERRVSAVLWVVGGRNFQSLLHDECWCLSLLCRNTALALEAHQDRRRVRDLSELAEGRFLDYHFGQEAAQALRRSAHPNEAAQLSARPSKDIVVVNIDIRGSTRLSEALASRGQREAYVRLVGEYHDRSRGIVLRTGGVIDKTMGDGIQALFNVYGNVLDVGELSRPMGRAAAQAAALECVARMFGMFEELVVRESRDWNVALPKTLALGAGLSIGDGWVGSFERGVFLGLDYSVLSEAANKAGKWVSAARASELAELLEAWLPTARRAGDDEVFGIAQGRRVSMDGSDVRRLIERLREPRCAVAIADLEFERTVERCPLAGYVLSPDGVERWLVLLLDDLPKPAV